ncbi:MAG: cytochrome P450 [Acetobacteraceae bacterium]
MAASATLGLLQLTSEAVANAVQDRISIVGKCLPPSPPIRHRWLGHLHDIRTEGFVAFHARCVREYGPLVLLRFGPPALGRRFLLVADPDVAWQTLTQDLQRNFPIGTGPRLAFGDDAVFCTAAADPVHERRRALIRRHVTPDMLRRHVAQMDAVWGPAVETLVSIPAGCGSIERFNINPAILFATQEAAIRCWMSVSPGPNEVLSTLERYFDTGNLLSEILFNTWFFLHAKRRVGALRTAYAPLLARALDMLADGDDAAPFIASSLRELGWDTARARDDAAYRAALLADLPIYQHLFTVMLPSMGSTGGTILFLLRQLAADVSLQDDLRRELAACDLATDPCPPPLTGQAIRECLRLYPQAAGITRYLTTARTYGGYFVPKGSYTFTHLHTLHRHACRHAEPDRFNSAREAGPPGSWAGFSIGPLSCTGRSFAELHIAVALKAILTRYRLTGAEPDPDAHNDYQGSVTLQPQPFSIGFTLP